MSLLVQVMKRGHRGDGTVCFGKDAMNAGMCILCIVYRVFVRFAQGQVQVEVHRGRQCPSRKEISYGVNADFFDQIEQANRLTAAFAHFDFDATLIHLDHLQEFNR